jgi:hypothetical protein
MHIAVIAQLNMQKNANKMQENMFKNMQNNLNLQNVIFNLNRLLV